MPHTHTHHISRHVDTHTYTYTHTHTDTCTHKNPTYFLSNTHTHSSLNHMRTSDQRDVTQHKRNPSPNPSLRQKSAPEETISGHGSENPAPTSSVAPGSVHPSHCHCIPPDSSIHQESFSDHLSLIKGGLMGRRGWGWGWQGPESGLRNY